MKRILFQGDSITDAGRNREDDNFLGSGYANMVAGWLTSEYPMEYECINRGIGGDRIIDIMAREKKDILNLKPDVISILVGVNGVWSELNRPRNGISAEKFEVLYDMLIQDIFEELPMVKIIIMGAFVLRGSGSETAGWEAFSTEVPKRAAAARRIAEKYGFPFIDLQKVFDEALKVAPESYWSVDGVHPTVAGHGLIAREWIRAFEILNRMTVEI